MGLWLFLKIIYIIEVVTYHKSITPIKLWQETSPPVQFASKSNYARDTVSYLRSMEQSVSVVSIALLGEDFEVLFSAKGRAYVRVSFVTVADYKQSIDSRKVAEELGLSYDENSLRSVAKCKPQFFNSEEEAKSFTIGKVTQLSDWEQTPTKESDEDEA